MSNAVPAPNDDVYAEAQDNPSEFDRPHNTAPHPLGLQPQAVARASAGTRIYDTGAMPRVIVPEPTQTKRR